MNKYSNQYHALKTEIATHYTKPFIAAIQTSVYQGYLNDVLAAAVCLLQKEVAREFTLTKPDHYLAKVEQGVLPLAFKGLVIQDTKIRDTYLKLGKYYLSTRDDFLAEVKRTIIRELLFDFLNPLPQLKLEAVDTARICLQEEQMITSLASVQKAKNTAFFMQLPIALQQHINGFLLDDHKAITSYRMINKHSYRLQKALQDQLRNVFYAAGCKLKISSSGHSIDHCVTDAQLVAATKLQDQVFLFPNLLDAIEYAHAREYSIEKDYIYVPTVVIVSYLGDTRQLKYQDNVITLHSGWDGRNYSDNRRSTCIAYTTVSKNALLPLAAVCLNEKSDFGAYHIFRAKFNFQPAKVSIRENTASKTADDENERAYAEIYIALNAIINKAQDLQTLSAKDHEVKPGSKILKDFNNKIIKKLKHFEQAFCSCESDSLARKKMLCQFNQQCAEIFSQVEFEFFAKEYESMNLDSRLNTSCAFFPSERLIINKEILQLLKIAQQKFDNYLARIEYALEFVNNAPYQV